MFTQNSVTIEFRVTGFRVPDEGDVSYFFNDMEEEIIFDCGNQDVCSRTVAFDDLEDGLHTFIGVMNAKNGAFGVAQRHFIVHKGDTYREKPRDEL